MFCNVINLKQNTHVNKQDSVKLRYHHGSKLLNGATDIAGFSIHVRKSFTCTRRFKYHVVLF